MLGMNPNAAKVAAAAAQVSSLNMQAAPVPNLPPIAVKVTLQDGKMMGRDPAGIKFLKWTVLYPLYLDSNHTKQEGRRCGKEASVPSPQPAELAEACLRLGFTDVILENYKGHPGAFLEIGRVRVLMKDEDGLPSHGDIPRKKDLLVRLAKEIAAMRSTRQVESSPAASAAPKQSTKVGKTKSKKKR